MLKAYLKYRRRAKGAHRIHSPFVFEFFNEVLKKIKTVDDADIQELRKALSHEHREIEVVDLGVGSKKNNSSKRKISQLAKVAAVNRKYGKLLNRIADHYKVGTCIELGTSLGLGTSYLAKSCKEVISIEGCPNTQMEAIRNTEKLNFSNIEFINSDFSEVLGSILSQVDAVDMVYVDGNHGYAPTMNYFETIMQKAHNETIIVFDDINWSDEMRKAWDEICASEKINVSTELFRMGIVFKREEQAKEHFVLKF